MDVFDFLRGDEDRDRFAERVMERLRRRGWPHPLRYDREGFAIDLGSNGRSVHLGNLHRDWLKFPKSERAAQLDKVAASVFEMERDTSWETVRSRLLPLVRPRVYFENCELSREHDWTGGPVAPQAVVAGPLCAVLAIDGAHGMGMVNQALLAKWGLSFDEALAVALENLRAASPCRFERQDGGFYLSRFGDWHDVSRLLLPDLIRQLPVRGDPVAIAIVREGLVVAGGDDMDALAAMAAFARNAFDDATRPISCAPLVLKGEGWEPFAPEDEALAALASLWRKQQVRDYAQQGDMLQRHFDDLGLDRFLAPLEAVMDGPRLRTWTSWTRQARPLLPRADAVVLIDSDGLALPRLWRDVEAVCGPIPEEGRTYPQRYGGSDWPDAECLERLRTTTAAPAWLAVEGVSPREAV